MGAQLIGGTIAAILLRGFFGPVAGLGATTPAAGVFQALGMEILLTAALMFVITAVATDTKAVGQLAAIMIGATVVVNAAWGGPVSRASMNPAGSVAPALAAAVWTDYWIYWVGPIVRAALGSAHP